uniref:LETM1-like protein n=1 Tax=Zea mays TaxID=4577 RepID=A0A804LSJ8_MAIZE
MATAVASQPCHLPLSAGGDPRCAASTSNVHTLEKVYGFRFICRSIVDVKTHKFHSRISKRKCYLRNSLSECDRTIHSGRWLEFRRHKGVFQRTRRMVHIIPLASDGDGNHISVNGALQVGSTSNIDEIKLKLNKALQSEDISNGLVQSIHDAARSIELALIEHSKLPKSSWFPKTWLGVENNAWIKSLSYQAAVDSLLKAVIDVSSRGNDRDRDINVFVQRSLSRLLTPLESVIKNELSKREPALYEWYSSDQNPLVVRQFVNIFENDPMFYSATAICLEGEPMNTSESDLSLLMLGLICLAAITKFGSAKVSCQQFSSMVPDIIGRFMDMLLEFAPLSKAYNLAKDIGLRREFLYNFGPRAAVPKLGNDHGLEISFWIELVQKQLLWALDREKIWSRLTTSESIEVLEKDLAIFGFFVALGRSTQGYLSFKGLTDLDDSLNGIVRYLIGGSVLYYPQLSSISSYQLYVEVVCEELEWLPFYNDDVLSAKTDTEGREEVPKGEVISRVLNVCSYWMTSFTKYSSWLENPSNVKAAKFLSKGHVMLSDCMKELDISSGFLEPEEELDTGTELASFDKSLENVEEALVKLENLLQELHVSSSHSGKEDLKAACSDLEMIRRLKKEAELLEASFLAKAEYLELITVANVEKEGMESNDILRFEQLRRELIELEKRVQKSADEAQKEEEMVVAEKTTAPSPGSSVSSRQTTKKENVITKSVEKVKETTTTVLQGTQLLAIDTGAAMGLLKRALIGDELTQKEKQALQRTLTDLASVVPIGILMLLPLTAVGHAAILAFIQRYVPSMIPSTYAPGRLDLLRQIEKVKEMEVAEGSSEDILEELNK